MAEFIFSLIDTYTYVGIFALMVAENVFPPIPSELVLPYIGYVAATGAVSFWVALVTATLGAFVGSIFWFYLGWWIGTERLRRFFASYGGFIAIEEQDFLRATAFFIKRQKSSVFVGRLIPGIRSVISIPAGCVRMSFKTFMTLTLLGTLVWNTMLMSAGFLVADNFAVVEKNIEPFANAVIYLIIALYLVQVIRFVWRRKKGWFTT